MSDTLPLGIVRAETVRPVTDLTALATLARATRDAGCAATLIALLEQSGLAFSVSATTYSDGQPNGHQGGNAIDVTGVTGTPGEIRAIRNYLAATPEPFSFAAYTDPDAMSSLLIWDGVVKNAGDLPEADAFAAQCTNHIHIASSTDRLLRAFAIDTNPGWGSDVVGGATDFYEPPADKTLTATVEQLQRMNIW